MPWEKKLGVLPAGRPLSPVREKIRRVEVWTENLKKVLPVAFFPFFPNPKVAGAFNYPPVSCMLFALIICVLVCFAQACEQYFPRGFFPMYIIIGDTKW